MATIGIFIKFSDHETLKRLTFAEARELYGELAELFEDTSGEYSTDWSKYKPPFAPIPPVTCANTLSDADVGRTVWARDTEGNSLSPEELKRRGDEFRKGKKDD